MGMTLTFINKFFIGSYPCMCIMCAYCYGDVLNKSLSIYAK